MSSPFKRAEKKRSKARILIEGPSGAGKTWTGLQTAAVLAEGGPVAVIDSEEGSASLYADLFEFDVLEIGAPFSPEKYVAAIRAAAKAGYPVILIDSLTHAWAGSGGVLDMVDAAKVRFNNNTQRAWSVGTPAWQSLVDGMLQSPTHIVATLRSKTRYVEETDDRGKVKGYKKAGAEPVARDGIEYEFTLTAALDLEHNMVVGKSRCPLVPPNTVLRQPKGDLAEAMLEWLNSGADALPPAAPAGEPDPVRELELSRARELLALADGDVEVVKATLAQHDVTRENLTDDDVWDAVREAVEARKAPADPAPETPATITEKDRRGLEAHATKHGLDHDALKALALELIPGITSTTQVPAEHLDGLRAAIETRGAELAAQAEAA